MKNTNISLDMLFIREDGTIAAIAENTVPQSLDTISVQEPVRGVLEMAGGHRQKAWDCGQMTRFITVFSRPLRTSLLSARFSL